MQNSRSFFLIALLFVGFLLWQQWQQDYRATTTTSPVVSSTKISDSNELVPTHADVPKILADALPNTPHESVVIPSNTQLIEVTTDVLKLAIDTRGGAVVQADLLAYPVTPNEYQHPVRLLDDDAGHYFVAQTGLISTQVAAPDHQAQFSSEKIEYILQAASADSLEVPLTWTDASGIKVRKIYVFKRGGYEIEQREEITNNSQNLWTGNEYRQLQRIPPLIASGGLSFSNPERYSFVGAAWYSPQEKFEKLRFDKYNPHEPLNRSITGGWAAMLQHYFLAAWIPPADEANQYSTAIVTLNGVSRYLIREISPAIAVAVGETKKISSRLYIGPKVQSQLAAVAPGFELTIDYGIFTVIAQPLFNWVLSPLHSLTGNWGWAIVLVVLLIKLMFFKLSEAQYRSMAKMRKFQPRLAALKERYGDDKQKYQAAMLELYQKEKINPMGGCLPMLVQTPVFFALYWVLLESVELRHAPFIGWIHNLSAPDPYYVLPVLNGIAMIASQWLSPAAGVDPMQAKMMKIMPVMFSVMFAFFPAGLVLYWTVNGTLSLIQQWIITQRVESVAKA